VKTYQNKGSRNCKHGFDWRFTEYAVVTAISVYTHTDKNSFPFPVSLTEFSFADAVQ
jgi:hypothetical protein